MLLKISLFISAILVGFIREDVAEGFPFNTRYGYANCQACHISPTGGGVLNAYGKMTAEDFLSTWHYEGESATGHGLFRGDLPGNQSVFFGGDVRTIELKTNGIERRFAMQQDLEVAFQLNPQLTIVGAFGKYAQGDELVTEFRRQYLLYNINDYVSFRAGRFFPAYGILVEDHTVATRRELGWDQGGETYNTELAIKREKGEVFITGTFGQSLEVSLTKDKGYNIFANEKGYAIRAAAYLGKSSQLGLSYFMGETRDDPLTGIPGRRRYIVGPYAMIGLGKRGYILAQHDWMLIQKKVLLKGEPPEKPVQFGYDLFGVEIFRGFHLQFYYETKDQLVEKGVKAQWFPRPHFEISGQYELTKFGNASVVQYHYYW